MYAEDVRHGLQTSYSSTYKAEIDILRSDGPAGFQNVLEDAASQGSLSTRSDVETAQGCHQSLTQQTGLTAQEKNNTSYKLCATNRYDMCRAIL